MGTSQEAIRRKVENRNYYEYIKSLKLTGIDVFTNVDNTWCFTNATPRDMKDSIKDIRMSIVHANSASHLWKWKTFPTDVFKEASLFKRRLLVEGTVIYFNNIFW